MKRSIVHIDEEKCNGCGACAEACQEGAIQMVEGKARLMRDDYCDGLGHCLPSCPTDAISIIEREADAFDEEAVRQNQAAAAAAAAASAVPSGCAGARAASIPQAAPAEAAAPAAATQLRQWPVQLQLAPLTADYYQDANLLVAADCAAYAYGGFHNRFMKNRVTLIGCPKLDDAQYADKLCEILKRNRIKSMTVVRMEVPCCGGIERAAVTALQQSGKFIPWQIVTLTTDGHIVEE